MTELAVSIRTTAGTEFQCKTINISSEGMALRTPRSMQEGDVVGAVFAISNPVPLMIAEGKAGVHLRFASSRDKDRISEWLDSEFYMQRSVERR